MNKSVIAVVLLVFSTMTSKGEICVDFSTDYGSDSIYDHTGVGNTPLAGGSLFIAYWTLDLVQDFNTADPTTPLNDDRMLGVLNTDNAFPLAGDVVGNTAVRYGTGGEYATSGRVYAVFFEMAYTDYSGPSSITNGTYYGLGGLAAGSYPNVSGDPGALGQTYGLSVLSANPIATTSQITAVPEPASFALFGLGLIVVGVRRRFKKS